MKKILFLVIIVLAGYAVNAQTSVPRKKVITTDSVYVIEIKGLETQVVEQNAMIAELQKQIDQLKNSSLQTNYGKRAVIDRRGSKKVVYK